MFRRIYRAIRHFGRLQNARALEADLRVHVSLPDEIVEGSWSDQPRDSDEQERFSRIRGTIVNSKEKVERLGARRKGRKA